MIVAKKIIEGALLSGSVASYYAAPENKRTLIKKLIFCNVSPDAVTVTVHLVPSGGSPSDANMIRKTRTVAPTETWECYEAENQVLESGGSIQAGASVAGKIAIHATGLEMT